ncbi:hypothetical protein Taro_005450 [Colocasia esculenta]|uniref:Uncharacterized protein n=1 Tax=Colocasia esculenta TaxID=4460 RepID=A0A843TSF4_COLES|nr:hypothetical protein [Colocasia esculenta]
MAAPAGRDSLSQEFVVGWSRWRLFPSCIANNLFEFIAYLIGLNSNPSGSSGPWVAARPSGSLTGVREVGLLQSHIYLYKVYIVISQLKSKETKYTNLGHISR